MNIPYRTTTFFRLLFIVGLTILPVCNSHALSMGLYLDHSSGSGSFKWDWDYYDFDVDTEASAIGFALDTAVLGGSLFNYRLNVGLEEQQLDDETGETLTLDGITVENIFGFAIMSGPDYRWWAGPLLRFGAYSGETDTHYSYSYGTYYKNEFDFVETGIGLATGVNIKVGESTILAPTLGIRSISAAGTGTTVSSSGFTIYEEDISGDYRNIFLNFALLF